MKYYDAKNKRLVFLGEKSSDHFWDRFWLNDKNLKDTIIRGEKSRWMKNITKRFLPSGGKVLEGGCGRGDKVYGLNKWGYDGYGVDYAVETVNKIRELFPDLRLQIGDVRRLSFSDGFFDGYWSIGVIEHFYSGFDEIVSEISRVLKPSGYAFVTFPYMSPLRKLKAKLGFYKEFKNEGEPKDFYQFALDKKKVLNVFSSHGLGLLHSRPMDAVKGLKDEVIFLRPLLRSIYHRRNFFARGIRFMVNICFSWFASHVMLLVFRKSPPS